MGHVAAFGAVVREPATIRLGKSELELIANAINRQKPSLTNPSADLQPSHAAAHRPRPCHSGCTQGGCSKHISANAPITHVLQTAIATRHSSCQRYGKTMRPTKGQGARPRLGYGRRKCTVSWRFRGGIHGYRLVALGVSSARKLKQCSESGRIQCPLMTVLLICTPPPAIPGQQICLAAIWDMLPTWTMVSPAAERFPVGDLRPSLYAEGAVPES